MASDTYSTAGSFTWTAPTGVTSVQVEAWGGGGGGGDDGGGSGGGGAGGGAYSKLNSYAVTPGNGYTVVVGDKGLGGSGAPGNSGTDGGYSLFVDSSTCYALGGSGGVGGPFGGTGGAGGASASGVGDTKYSGGAGANASALSGGGSGSSAGTGAAGANGVTTTGGTAPAGGGNGGNEGAAGTAPGGGGGGAASGGSPADGAVGKVILTYTAASPDNAGFRSPIIGMKIVEDPFPGAVIALKNPYGDPPANLPSRIPDTVVSRTVNPEPFAGQVISIRPAMGETPLPPDSTSIRTYRPVPEELPLFPGAVIASPPPRFGLSSIPVLGTLPPPQVVSEQSVREPFSGQVIANRPTFEAVRSPLVPAAIARTSEPVQPISQPVFWSGTHEPPAVNPAPVVIRYDVPTPYEGSVTALQNGYGVPPLPSTPVVIRYDSFSVEPGRVISVGGPDEGEGPPQKKTATIVAGETRFDEVVQPKSWAGVPQRDASFGTVAIVRQLEENPFGGRVSYWSNPYGVSPDPSRPVTIRESEGFPAEPGKVLFSRTVQPEPNQNPRIFVIGLDSTFSDGQISFLSGRSAPTVVAPSPMIVAGDTRYPDVGKPFFGYWWRTGTSAPSGVTPGNPVALTGYDDSAVSLTSEDCVCR